MKNRQKGMVLLMTMVILVMVTGLSVFALKRSVLGEQIAKNMRSQAFAMQMAEGALRYCEDAVILGKKTIEGKAFVQNKVTAAMAGEELPSMWKNKENWKFSSNQMANVIPSNLLVTQDATTVPDALCMVEEFSLPVMTLDLTTAQPYLITSIGYTADYRANASGVPSSGSEVWLQSIIRP